jgi:hypothetical protein
MNAMAKESKHSYDGAPTIFTASTSNVPTIGPAQKNYGKCQNIKKIPAIPPLSAFLSTLFAHDCAR